MGMSLLKEKKQTEGRESGKAREYTEPQKGRKNNEIKRPLHPPPSLL